MYIKMLRLKTNVVDLASCQLAAILASMSFPQHVFTTTNLGVAVKTLCCGRDKFKVYCILNYKYSVYSKLYLNMTFCNPR